MQFNDREVKMIKQMFDCDSCETQGMVTIRTDGVEKNDIIYCPVCASPILRDEDDLEDE